MVCVYCFNYKIETFPRGIVVYSINDYVKLYNVIFFSVYSDLWESQMEWILKLKETKPISRDIHTGQELCSFPPNLPKVLCIDVVRDMHMYIISKNRE